MQAIYDALVGFFAPLWEWIVSFFSNLEDMFIRLLNSIVEGIAAFFQSIIDFLQPVVDFFADIVYFFTQIGQVIIKIFVLFGSLLQVLGSVVQGVVNTITSLYSYDAATSTIPNNPFAEGMGVFLDTVAPTGFNVIPYILMFGLGIMILLKIGELVRGKAT